MAFFEEKVLTASVSGRAAMKASSSSVELPSEQTYRGPKISEDMIVGAGKEEEG